MRYTLYIFDMGGVVLHNSDVFPEVTRYLNITGEDFLALAGENLERLFHGKVTTDEFWAAFSGRYGGKVEEEFGKFFTPSLDQRTVEFVEQLEHGSRVVCGTNTFEPHYDYLSGLGYYNIFDAVYASNKIGISKPDPAFYRYILRSEGTKPEHAFFVDDTEVNVLSARNMGITSMIFTDLETLRAQINRHHDRPFTPDKIFS
jgi:HAD superfamily hydrolase (TIGR01549 family)